jgi:hypothetical protein
MVSYSTTIIGEIIITLIYLIVSRRSVIFRNPYPSGSSIQIFLIFNPINFKATPFFSNYHVSLHDHDYHSK